MRLSTCLMVAALTISDAIYAASLAAEQSGPLAPAQLREARREAAHRQRRIIFNNDGDDVLCFSAAPTPEALLEARTSALVGSQVDTIFYCSSQSFGMTLHQQQGQRGPDSNRGRLRSQHHQGTHHSGHRLPSHYGGLWARARHGGLLLHANE